jgi:hypothetical protein
VPKIWNAKFFFLSQRGRGDVARELVGENQYLLGTEVG